MTTPPRSIVSCLSAAQLFLNILLPHTVNAQELDLWQRYEIDMPCSELPMTMIKDAQGRPFLYVAQKEGGISVFNVADTNEPILVARIDADAMNGSHATSLTQRGDRVFVALGDIFKRDQAPGLAIIDVSVPTAPTLLSAWSYSEHTSGAGDIVVDGNYAYLAAMQHGLLILDISGDSISFIDHLPFDLDFPDANPDTAKYNVRGLYVEGQRLYVAFDAGGLRVVDIADPRTAHEIGRYSNPTLNGRPRAYNNVAVHDHVAYVTVDYCGLEILDVNDASNISQLSWWNPWNCPQNNWFTSPGHTNEIVYIPDCGIVYMSTGRSDLYAVDVQDVTQPDSIGVFGTATDTEGTWGVSSYGSEIFLSYICTLGIPFPGSWAGVRSVAWARPCIISVDEPPAYPVTTMWLSPNPAGSWVRLDLSGGEVADDVWLTDITGSRVSAVWSHGKLHLEGVPSGMFHVHARLGSHLLTGTLIVQP